MKHKILTGLIGGLAFLNVHAQIDTIEIKNVWLKEIVIQTDTHSNSKEVLSSNKQKSTDGVLNTIPGVSLIKRGGYAWEPGIRGLNFGQVQTTIDGMAIFGACTDRMDPVSSYIEPSNMRSIVVSYGTNEEASGNNIGGGVNFKIRQPSFSSKKQIKGNAGTGYESNGNAFNIFSAVDYSNKRIGVNVNAIYRSADNYKTGQNKALPFSQYTKWNTGLGIKYKTTEHSNLHLNYIHDEGRNIGYPALLMDVLFAKADIVSLTHNIHLPDKALNKIETKVYYNFIDHAMDDTRRPAEEVFMHMDMPGTSETIGLYSNITWQIDKISLTTKFSGYQNRLHSEMTMYPEDGTPMFMLTLPDVQRRYAEMNISASADLSEKISLTAGGTISTSSSGLFTEEGKHTIQGTLQGDTKRLDAIYSFFVNPTFNLSPKAVVFLNGALSSRLPTLQELYGFYLFNRPDGYDYLGNPDLKKESSFNISAGGRYRTGSVSLSAKGFAYFMMNYIAGRVLPGYDKMTEIAFGVKQYQNLPSALLTGFEAEGEVKINNALRFTSTNSFSYGKDFEKNALPFIPPFRSIDKLEVVWKDVSFTPEVVFAARQSHVSNTIYGETASPSYAVFNFSTGKDFALKQNRIYLLAGVTNIFNLDYYDHTSVMKIPERGRSFFIQTKIQW
ncbi:MAG: TonB-dependent receptor [Chitinophagaceae bacterium]|nr:TonB-dependent receptor [Chitinophagaceae bacterium]